MERAKTAPCEWCDKNGVSVVPFGVRGYNWMHPECWLIWKKQYEDYNMTNFPPGGALFVNDKRTAANHPNYNGSLEISAELAEYLKNCADDGKPVKMDLSGWKKTANASGKPFISLSAQIPWKERQNMSAKKKPIVKKVEEDLNDDFPFDDDLSL